MRLVWIPIALLFFCTPLAAQISQCDEKRDVEVTALDELTWKQLNRVYEEVGEENYNEAFSDLQKMLGRAGRDEYLQAVLYQAMAQVEWSRKNYDQSLGYFERAVELDVLPNQTHFALMYQISQLYFMNDRYDESLAALELWFCKIPSEQVTSHAYVLKASINAQKQDYRETVKAIDTAISMEAEPKQNWYQLKYVSHYELKELPQAADTLEIMISRWPDKKDYWLQLAQIRYSLGQEDRALAAMALAYRKNMLDKQSDLNYLANLYNNANVPYKAAQVLERGISAGIVEGSKENWTLVAETWYEAEELERSLVAFEKAGQVAADGDIDLRRGFILVDMEDWPVALEALNEALEKGGLGDKRTGEALLLRGMAQFNLGNLDSASADWGKAARYENTRDAARQWMNHLREERQRRAS